MVRLFIKERFKDGQAIHIPESELRYFKSVRRGQGEISLFNDQNQEAFGKIEKNIFFVERVMPVKVPLYDLTVAAALPEVAVISDIIRSVSELGARKLLFFKGQRSQAAFARLQRLHDNKRWGVIAVESARQCGRGIPLEVVAGDWRRENLNVPLKIFFDEKVSSSFSLPSSAENGIVLIGPEGGWTEEERKEAKTGGFQIVHWDTPILKVPTAVICGTFFALQKMNSTSLH